MGHVGNPTTSSGGDLLNLILGDFCQLQTFQTIFFTIVVKNFELPYKVYIKINTKNLRVWSSTEDVQLQT